MRRGCAPWDSIEYEHEFPALNRVDGYEDNWTGEKGKAMEKETRMEM